MLPLKPTDLSANIYENPDADLDNFKTTPMLITNKKNFIQKQYIIMLFSESFGIKTTIIFFLIKFSIKYTGQHENSKLNANLNMSRNVLYK